MNPNQNQHDDGLLSNGRNDPNLKRDSDQVVNEEDQNVAVNPVGGERGEESNEEQPGEIQIPDGGSEVESPQRIEGDDAASTERKIPNL
jgi:hypothetical protein